MRGGDHHAGHGYGPQCGQPDHRGRLPLGVVQPGPGRPAHRPDRRHRWDVLRWAQLRQAHQANFAVDPLAAPAYREPPARRLLRISFGLLWIFDGLLQGQASMPLGMAPQVIRPAAAVSPAWVQHLDNAVATIWSYHPVAAPAAAVWIQVGLGFWLLAAPRGQCRARRGWPVWPGA